MTTLQGQGSRRLSAGLSRLVAALDAAGGVLTEGQLRSAFAEARVTAEDVAGWVAVTPGRYARRRVVRRGAYELLVMTWGPGQLSGPHDHAGSLCGLQVVSGRLREQYFRDGPDGACEPTGESFEGPGSVCVDPGVVTHALGNADATEVLVTVHVYSPPLNDLRRHARRPVRADVPPVFSRGSYAEADRVVIVGGGFSGTMAAAHLLRAQTPRPLEVVLIDASASVAEGVAYRTADPGHLLNVPAGRMSAWPDVPDDFVSFARSRDPRVSGADFLPRGLYGAYLRDCFDRAAKGAAQTTRCLLLRDSAESIVAGGDGGRRWLVTTARGERISADAVVLAPGHRPPADPFARKWTGPRDRWVPDPWAALTLAGIGPDEPVLLMGSGLTAIDAVLSLAGSGGTTPRTAPIHLLSPRGLLPQSHATGPLPPADVGDLIARCVGPEGVPPRRLLRALRDHAASQTDWRQTLDALRSRTPTLWQAMTPDQRAQFLRHARRYWEVHRHRIPPQIARRISELRDAGLLRIHAGRVRSIEASESGVRAGFTPLHGVGGEAALDVAWVINCTGPGIDTRTAPHPVLRSLLSRGAVAASEMGLGLDTTADGRAIDAEGRPVDSLLVVGTLRKATLWESTAVPELRVQAAMAAERTLAVLARAEAAVTYEI